MNNRSKMKAQYDLPKSVGIVQKGESQVIFRLWRNPFAYALGAIGLVLIGFCVAIIEATSDFPVTHPIQLFPIIFSLVAVVMMYIAAVRFVNSTRIIVCEKAIQVTNGPLPWRKGCVIPKEEIGLIVVRSSTTTYDANKATFCNVYLRLKKNQNEICILDGDVSNKEAFFVAESLGNISGLDFQKM